MKRPKLWAAILIAIACVRTASTYRVFSATSDEATHVGAGLGVLQLHEYMVQWENPPLARVVLAIVPDLGGMTFNPAGNYYDQLHSVFYGPNVKYERSLALARCGNLVFFILAAVALFAWVQRQTDSDVALAAVFLFTFEPVILGHAGLATVDMAATASLATCLWAFSIWTERRTWLLPIAYAFAILCKFSNIAFVPAACFGMWLAAPKIPLWLRTKSGGMAAAVQILLLPFLIWAAYAFNVGTFSNLTRVRDVCPAAIEQFIATHPHFLVPAPKFVWGVLNVIRIDRHGFPSYFFGHVGWTGWRSYFPVAIALKSTIPLLLLVLVGLARRKSLPFIAPALLILIVASRSHLDLGVRYVLPVYISLAATAAIGLLMLPKVARVVAIGAVVITSLAAHPDYFPYFNAFAGRDPSRDLVDSNLDWGQDVLRLRSALRHEHVDRLAVLISGAHDYGRLGFPETSVANPMQAATGWVAISDHVYRMEQANGGWAWLEKRQYKRIGKSIRLYFIEP